ncbi:MAG: GWxTD domain-containing protein, partial [Candidatus Latescibacteria bacterium]|nr:GWxTD domain-containing protein [Candidatus Latescibacterota bacterium]
MERGSTGLGIGILLIVCVFGEIDAKDARNRASVDSLYQATVEALGSTSTKESIDAFNRVLKADRKYTLAHYHLAKLYATCNTVNDRQRAKRAIENAIRLGPGNTDFRLAFGDILWQQAKWNEAETQYQKAFQLDTLNADVPFKIGTTALDSYLKFTELYHIDRISPMNLPGTSSARGADGFTYTRFDWAHFAEEAFKRATTFLHKCTQIDPTYREAYYKLGLAHYENRHPEKLIGISAQLLKHMPGDKNGLLFMALGLQAINRLDQSSKLFTAAIKRMVPTERAMMESLDLISTLETQQQIQQTKITLPDSIQTWAESDVHTLFWQKQDPLHLTTYNERRMAHYGRVAYANLRYSRPERNIAGWQSDMGQAYIKYGRPLNRSVERADDQFKYGMDVQITNMDLMILPETLPADRLFDTIRPNLASLNNSDHQTETWIYENFKLAFISADGRNGRLASPTPKTPRYVDPYKNQKYTTPHQILAFKEPDGVRLEVAYALPSKRFKPQPSTLDDGLFIIDPEGREINKQTHQSTVQWNKSKTRWDQHHVLTRQTHLSPGNYDILVEARDQHTGSIATFRENRTLTLSDTSLAMSDLFLARHIREKTSYPKSRTDLAIEPNPIRTYGSSDPVYVYLEVYNLTRNDFGKTRFDITYHISTPQQDEIDPTLFIDQNLAH